MRARTSRLVLFVALALLSPGMALADEDADDFDTTWFGARVGLWYRPQMDMKVAVSGRSPTAQIFGALGAVGNTIDVKRDLGMRENATGDYGFANSILETEIFFDSRWASVNLWIVAPYEYEGETTLTRSITFGGQTFTLTQAVESKFRQTHAGIDIRINLLNDEYLRVSPIVALRALGIDWEIEAGPLRGDTSDIDTPMEFNDLQIIPYPEIGAEVRLGLRKWFEVDVKLTGTVMDYLGVEGHTFTFEAGVTGYPIPFIGVRLGARYLDIDFESSDQNDPQDSYMIDAQFFGANISLIVRFG